MRRTILVIFFITSQVFAYEKETHYKLTDQAVYRSSKFSRFMNNNAFKADDLLLSSVLNGQWTIQRSYLAGAENEDGYPPFIIYPPEVTALRSGNHFFDPIHDLPLSDPCVATPFYSWSRAKDWAIAGEGPFENNYSISEIKESIFNALTADTTANRKRELFSYFSGVGHILHLIQDMAVPAHVRNDAHIPSCLLGDCPGSENPQTERYEEYCVDLTGLIYFQPNAVYNLHHYDYFWAAPGDVGLADFTNNNFVSQDTNLDHHLIECREPLGYPNPVHEGFQDVERYHQNEKFLVRYYWNTVRDNYTGEVIRNDYLSASSMWNFITESYSDRRIFYLSAECHARYARLLLPRATAYSIGLLDFMFRGQLKVNLGPGDAPGTQKITLQNWSDNNEALSNGFVTIVAHNPYDPLNPNDDIWITLGPYYLDSLVNKNIDPYAYWQQELNIPSFDAVKDLTIIYRGRLGEENDEIIATQYKIEPFAFLKLESASIALQTINTQSQGTTECHPSNPYGQHFGLSEQIDEIYNYKHYTGSMKYFNNAKLIEIDLNNECAVLIADGQSYVGKWTRSSPSQPNPEHIEIIADLGNCPTHNLGFKLKFEGASDYISQTLPGTIKRIRTHATSSVPSLYNGWPYPDCGCYRTRENYIYTDSVVDSRLVLEAYKILSINGYTAGYQEDSMDYIQFKNDNALRIVTEYLEVSNTMGAKGHRHELNYHELYDDYTSSCNCAPNSECWNRCQSELPNSVPFETLEAISCQLGQADIEAMHPILTDKYQDVAFPDPLVVRIEYPYSPRAKQYGYEYEILDIPFSLQP